MESPKFVTVHLTSGIDVILNTSYIMEVSNKEALIGECMVNYAINGMQMIGYKVKHSMQHMTIMLNSIDCTTPATIN